MARRLSHPLGTRPWRARPWAWVCVVAAVIAAHGCITDGVMSRMKEGTAEAEMPARMEVDFVREMALAPPPPVAAGVAPAAVDSAAPAPRRPAPRRIKPKAAARIASAPEPAASEPAPSELAAVAAAVPVSAPQASSAPAAVESVATASSGAARASPDAAAASASAGFQWPTSTRVSYLLTGNYRGEVSGTAEVEWIRDGSHYQVHVDFLIGPRYAPLITQHSTSDGDITAAGLAPRRYDQAMTVFGSTRPLQTVLFDAGNVVLANGDVRPMAAGMQDTASQFVQLTYLFSTRPDALRIGGSVAFPLALPKKIDTYVYDVVAEDRLETPFGSLPAIHLKPRNVRQPGSIGVEMWFAPQLQYFPARLRFEQDEGVFVDLMISRPPQMALR